MDSQAMVNVENASNNNSFRLLRWVSAGIGLSWITGVLILLVASSLLDERPASVTNPCPSCSTENLEQAGGVALIVCWLLAIATASLMRFRLFKDGPDRPRFAAMLLLIGLLLLAVYGLGLIVLIPGLLMLASSTEEVRWLSLRNMTLIVVGLASLVPLLMFASTLDEPWSSFLYLPPLLHGVGWIRLALDTPRSSV